MFLRFFSVFVLLVTCLSANIADVPDKIVIEGGFAKNKRCVRCHLDIYIEFKYSKHRLSNVLNDPIHKAMWGKNPLKKEQRYACAKCHAPAAEKIEDIMSGKAVPQEGDKSIDDGISCAYCHKIKDIEKHGNEYKNIVSEEKARYFGNRKVKMESDFHKIELKNKKFKKGDICLACHTQHSKNKHLVLRKDEKGNQLSYCVYSKTKKDETATINTEKENCVTCHMPQVEGSLTDRIPTDTHAYHGFAGITADHKMLEKYVEFKLDKTKEGFEISIVNNAPHDLMLHPIRQAALKVTVEGEKTVKLKDVLFYKQSTDEAVEPLSWLKKPIESKNTIPGKSTKKISFKAKISEGDAVNIILGYYPIRKDIAEKVGFKDEKSMEFKEFKRKTFFIE